jgi:hypothetical protein
VVGMVAVHCEWGCEILSGLPGRIAEVSDN